MWKLPRPGMGLLSPALAGVFLTTRPPGKSMSNFIVRLIFINCCWSVTKSCPTLYNPMDCSTPGLTVLHYLPHFAQTHVYWVGDAIKESWVPKNWCFWSVVWRRLLRVPWTARRSRPVHPKGNQSWIFIGRTDVEAETPILWLPDAKNWLIGKDPWCWERVRAGGEGDDRGWDGWLASPTQWAWVWVNSSSWWWAGRSGMLQSMGLQRVRHDWVTELNWCN